MVFSGRLVFFVHRFTKHRGLVCGSALDSELRGSGFISHSGAVLCP